MSSDPSPQQQGKRKRQDGSQSPGKPGAKNLKVQSDSPLESSPTRDSESTFAPVIAASAELEDGAAFAEAVGKFIEGEKKQIEALCKGDISGTNGNTIISEANLSWENVVHEYDQSLKDEEKDVAEFLNASALIYLILLGRNPAWTTKKRKDSVDVIVPKYDEKAARGHITTVKHYFSILTDSTTARDGDLDADNLTPKGIKKLVIALHVVLGSRLEDMRIEDDSPRALIATYERTQDCLLDYVHKLSGAAITDEAYKDAKLAQDHYRNLRYCKYV